MIVAVSRRSRLAARLLSFQTTGTFLLSIGRSPVSDMFNKFCECVEEAFRSVPALNVAVLILFQDQRVRFSLNCFFSCESQFLPIDFECASSLKVLFPLGVLQGSFS
jgi:hypothetical protein